MEIQDKDWGKRVKIIRGVEKYMGNKDAPFALWRGPVAGALTDYYFS